MLLSARAVTGLTKLNAEKRASKNVDKTFLKALVIAVCTLKRFKGSPNSLFHDGEIEFIKDLFEFRVSSDDSNGNRLASFGKMIDKVCEEIRRDHL